MDPIDTHASPFASHPDASPPAPDGDRAGRRVSSSILEGSGARVGNLARALVRRIRRQPLKSLLVATSGGFVIGGALSFRAGRIILVAAARRVAREFLKQVL